MGEPSLECPRLPRASSVVTQAQSSAAKFSMQAYNTLRMQGRELRESEAVLCSRTHPQDRDSALDTADAQQTSGGWAGRSQPTAAVRDAERSCGQQRKAAGQSQRWPPLKMPLPTSGSLPETPDSTGERLRIGVGVRERTEGHELIPGAASQDQDHPWETPRPKHRRAKKRQHSLEILGQNSSEGRATQKGPKWGGARASRG